MMSEPRKVSINIDNATTLTWEEEHRYLQPSDVVKLVVPCKKKENENDE